MNADIRHEYTELSYEYYNVSHGVRGPTPSSAGPDWPLTLDAAYTKLCHSLLSVSNLTCLSYIVLT